MSCSSGLDAPLEEGELSDMDEEQEFLRELEDGEVASDEEETANNSPRVADPSVALDEDGISCASSGGGMADVDQSIEQILEECVVKADGQNVEVEEMQVLEGEEPLNATMRIPAAGASTAKSPHASPEEQAVAFFRDALFERGSSTKWRRLCRYDLPEAPSAVKKVCCGGRRNRKSFEDFLKRHPETFFLHRAVVNLAENLFAKPLLGMLEDTDVSLASVEQPLPGPAVPKRLPENAKRKKKRKRKPKATVGTIAKCPTKRQRSTAENDSLKQKVQDLPLLCVEAICKFTPTSKLFRLYSNAVPLPGAYWHSRVEATLEKRSPFSLSYAALFDVSGAKVAGLRKPEAFRFSPLCALIKGATMEIVGIEKRGTVAVYILHGEAVLSCLPMLTELSLVMHRPSRRQITSKEDLFVPNLKHLLPRLELFSMDTSNVLQMPLLDAALTDVFQREIHLHEAPNLRHLNLPERAFGGLQEMTANCAAESSALSKLSSLGIWQPGASLCCIAERFAMLQFLAHSCRQVTTLFLRVVGDFKLYLAAFRALTGLRTLGLSLDEVDLTEFTFNDSETIKSVSSLRMIFSPHLEYESLVAVIELFPSTRAIALQCIQRNWDSTPVLAMELCKLQVLPKLDHLSCFLAGDTCACSSNVLAQLIADECLPKTVDLSDTFFENLPRDAGLLTRIYCAMQSNSTKTLLLRGPVHREALAILRNHVDFNDPNAKITARKNRDLGDQVPNSAGILQETDVKIVGRKTAGRFKGEQFVIRVVHQLTKRTDIFG